jgi:hypothetical protein
MFTKQNIFINVSKMHLLSERHTAFYLHTVMFLVQLKQLKPGFKLA